MTGVKLATAYYELIPSTQGAQADITRQFTGIGKSASKGFGGSFSRGLKSAVAPAIALLGAASVGQFLKDSVGEAREAQKVGALTNNVIKQTGGVANVSAKQVGRLSTAISNKTGMDDEAIQSGANLLLTFKNVRNEAGKNAKVFDRATQAAADLSAAGFGDLNGASKQLGKALNDPIKGISALSRAGVTFTESQKKQIKGLVAQNDLLGAQKIILKEVESQVGGAAAASSTMGEKASVAFGNFKESIGTALLPVIDDFNRKLVEDGVPAGERFADFFTNKAVPAMRDFGDTAGPLARSTLPALGTALGVAADAAAVLAPAVKSIVDSFNSLPKGVQTAIVLGGGATMIGKKAKNGLTAPPAVATKGGGGVGFGLALATVGVVNTKDQVDTYKRLTRDYADASSALAATLTKDGTATSKSIAAIRAEFEKGRIGKYASDLGVDLDKLTASFAKNGIEGKYVKETLARLDSKYSKSKDIADDAFGHLIGQTESSKIAAFASSLKELGTQYQKAGDKAYQNGNQTRDLAALMLGGKKATTDLGISLDSLGRKKPAPKVSTPGLFGALEGAASLGTRLKNLDKMHANPTVTVGGLAGAQTGIAGLIVGMNTLNRKTADLKAGKAYASGTNSAARGVALVGEEGPELVRFGGGEQVLTADQTRRLAAAPLATQTPSGGALRLVRGTLSLDASGRAFISGIAEEVVDGAFAHSEQIALMGAR